MGTAVKTARITVRDTRQNIPRISHENPRNPERTKPFFLGISSTKLSACISDRSMTAAVLVAIVGVGQAFSFVVKKSLTSVAKIGSGC